MSHFLIDIVIISKIQNIFVTIFIILDYIIWKILKFADKMRGVVVGHHSVVYISSSSTGKQSLFCQWLLKNIQREMG